MQSKEKFDIARIFFIYFFERFGVCLYLLIFSSLHIPTREIEFPKNSLISLFCSYPTLSIGISPSSNFKSSSASTSSLFTSQTLPLWSISALLLPLLVPFGGIVEFINKFTVFGGGSFINLFLKSRKDFSKAHYLITDQKNKQSIHKVLKSLLQSTYSVSIDLVSNFTSFRSGAGTFCGWSKSFGSISCDSFFLYWLLRTWWKWVSFTCTNPVIPLPLLTSIQYSLFSREPDSLQALDVQRSHLKRKLAWLCILERFGRFCVVSRICSRR